MLFFLKISGIILSFYLKLLASFFQKSWRKEISSCLLYKCPSPPQTTCLCWLDATHVLSVTQAPGRHRLLFWKGCALEELNTSQPSVLPGWKLLFVSRPFYSKRGAIISFRSAEPSTSESNNLGFDSSSKAREMAYIPHKPLRSQKHFQAQPKPFQAARVLSTADQPPALHLPKEREAKSSTVCFQLPRAAHPALPFC